MPRCRMRPSFIALILVLLLPDAALSANSQWHAASTLYPDASCPWVLGDTATPEAPALSGGVLTLSTSPASEDVYYEQTGSSLSIPSTLTISARLRVVSESHLPGNPRRGVAVAFAVAPDQINFLWLGHDEVFIWSAYGVQGPTALVDTDNAFHTYDITVVNQSTVTVHQDGVQILAGSIIGTGGSVTAPRIWWGEGTSSASATSEWVFFRHNANTTECGTPSLSVTDAFVIEGNSGTVNSTLTVNLSSPTAQDVTVNYATTDGTATTSNNDYTPKSGSLTIPAEAASTTVTVVVHGDPVAEDTETFFLNLLDATNATIADGQGRARIGNDDGPGMSLAWNDGPPSGLENRTFACNANVGSHTLVGTFIAPAGVTHLSGMIAQIDVTSDGPLPDWWKFGLGQCRQGSLSASFDFTGGPFTYQDPWQAGAIGGVAYSVISPNRACISIVCNLPANDSRIGPLDAGAGYNAFKLRIDNLLTTGTGACSGCSTPVSFTLNSMQLTQPVGVSDGDVEIFEPFLSTAANWQGGPLQWPAATLGTLSIADASVTEGNSGTSTMTFTLTRSNHNGCETQVRRSVSYSVVPGSATADDFVPTSGTVVVPGAMANVNVTVNGDGTPEPDETLLVNLVNPRGVVIADGQAVGTIHNDDAPTGVLPGAGPSWVGASPNPFRNGVELSFTVASGALVRLEIFDLSGRRVRVLPDTYFPAGPQTLVWDGLGDDGIPQPSGVYSLRVSGHGLQIARRVVRLR